MQPRSAVRAALLLTGLSLVPFVVARIALAWVAADDFRDLTAAQWLWAFVHGVRFDLAILLIITGPALILLALPWLTWGVARQALGWLGFAGLMIQGVILASDVIYFTHTHRHIGQEIRGFATDGVIAGAIIQQYALAIVGVVLALVGYAWLWVKTLALPVALPKRHVPAGLLWLFLVGLVVLGIRGAVFSKPIHVINAFQGTTVAGGQLTLNGPFVLAKTVFDTAVIPYEFQEPAKARQATVAAIATRLESAAPEHPLDRQRTAASAGVPTIAPGARPNIIVLMLESWGAGQVGATRMSAGLPDLGLTPNFDAAAKEGLFFANAYAAGQRSMEGLAALLAGMPTVPGIPFVGEGLESARLRWLGEIVKGNGYATWFAQGSVRQSYRVDAISQLAGFDQYFGAQDIPGVPGQAKGLLGAHDDDLLQFTLKACDKLPQPFLSWAFTVSTHGPFRLPEDRWIRAKPGDWIGEYRDTLHYADWAVGRFLAGVKNAPWGKNTIVVLMADHSWGPDCQSGDPRNLHRVPLLLWGLGLPEHLQGEVRTDPVCQADLVPTVMELTGTTGGFTGVGRSVLGPIESGRGVLCVNGSLTSWIDATGWVVHQGPDRVALGGTGDPEPRSAALRAVQQITTEGLLMNRVLSAK